MNADVTDDYRTCPCRTCRELADHERAGETAQARWAAGAPERAAAHRQAIDAGTCRCDYCRGQRAYNERTRPGAYRHKQPWSYTEGILAVLRDENLTHAQAGAALGRTATAVSAARHRLAYGLVPGSHLTGSPQ